MIAFDSDVIIYATTPHHPQGEKIHRLLYDSRLRGTRFGSILLIPELLSKPIRTGDLEEIKRIEAALRKLELIPADKAVATKAANLAATYRLKNLDAIHLASAIHSGADLFLTNNRKDFDAGRIREIKVTYPEML